MVEIRSGKSSEFNPTKIEEFKKLVLSEGRVREQTLPGLMERATRLVMLFDAGQVIGTAAIKAPDDDYRRRVFRKTGLAEQESKYPCELGWVVVHPDHRERGHSRRLVEAALAGIERVYATSQDRDGPMHRTLQNCGFAISGVPYQSRENRDSKILLFLR